LYHSLPRLRKHVRDLGSPEWCPITFSRVMPRNAVKRAPTA
jgi:hypothetical protein